MKVAQLGNGILIYSENFRIWALWVINPPFLMEGYKPLDVKGGVVFLE